MWGQVLGMAFFVSLNPMLLAFILLVISRPRPVPNLLAFWVGAVIVNVPIWLLSLMAVHLIPSFESVAQDLANPEPGSSVQPLQLGTGVFCLAVAALIAVRFRTRKRADEPAPVGAGGNTSTMVLESETRAADSQAPGRVRGAIANAGAAIQRVRGRVQDAWENGAVWVSLLFGFVYLPPPPLVLLIVTIVVGSGVAIGTQVLAILVFIIAMLAVFEIVLLSYVVAPARTEAVLNPVHEWARTHRLHVLLVLFIVVGIWQVVTGAGLV